jgi:hypothetical protein
LCIINSPGSPSGPGRSSLILDWGYLKIKKA